MSDPVSGEVVSVTGGAAGIAAAHEEVRRLADGFDAEGDRLREHAAVEVRVARDPDLVESGLLAPATCARAEAAVLTAGSALVAASLGWEADAVAVRVAVAALEAADDASRCAVTALDRRLAPLVITLLGPSVALDPGLLTERPGLTEHVVNGLGGPSSAGLAGLLYGGPGRPAVTAYPGSVPGHRPASVRDLVEHLHEVASLSGDPDSPANGTVEVQTVRLPDGSVRHVVYLPGTDRFNAPWDQTADVRDLETDLDAMGGRPDAYSAGVLEALRRAGVSRDEPLLLVGHSLGGMVAAGLAAGHSGYHVTDVVTAGSPTAQLDGFPPGTHVLSLEQVGDVVPELDGAPNPDSVEQTTVRFDAEPGEGVLAHHAYGVYEDGAGLVDASHDPSVTAAVAALHEHGFLGEDGEVTGQLFQVVRGP